MLDEPVTGGDCISMAVNLMEDPDVEALGVPSELSVLWRRGGSL